MPYISVGMVKQPTTEHSEFTMSNEDFPALPGTQNLDDTCNTGLAGNIDNLDKSMNSIIVSSLVTGKCGLNQEDKIVIEESILKNGVQTFPDGMYIRFS